MLAGCNAAAAAEEADATQPNSRKSLGNSVATEILDSEDDEEESGSDEEEEQAMKGTPTTALCEQVVPLLRYLDRKVTKYADPRQPGSYVELVVNQTRDEKFEEAKKEFAKEQAKLADELDFEQT
ncbi:hypothetical protein AXG93_2732s1000 [Marchantia polymorpha subsp. ruderalis]|uniref:Uncharacterized protein n=1 Tax=Marchantia polymorpha subsp. ruderalis TaxID=1480154 RepID=A0A176VGQ2_MARPO|nr:hypothetical protein AXG93_2732s1000 [Marchantia polymorpha subsp. ruderalis]